MVHNETLITADIAVAALHILISFIFFLAAMSSLGDGKMADKERKSFVLTSGIFWLISLLACITILVILTFVKTKEEKTPCPIQISEPGDQNREEIEDFINEVNTLTVDNNNAFPAFDSSLSYVVVTGYYKNRLVPSATESPDGDHTFLPDSSKNLLLKAIQKFSLIPIGYIKDDIIYGLGGKPVFDIQ